MLIPSVDSILNSADYPGMGAHVTGQRRRIVVPAILILSAVAAAAAWAIMRYGIRMTPDSWSYWTSSVNLLHGRGYHHLNGRPIQHWPPGYPLYLAGWQSIAGVSGRSLTMANVVLIGLATCTWTAAFFLPFKQELERAAATRPRSLLLPLLASIFIVATIISYSRIALAHNLAYVLYPLVLYATNRTLRDQREGRWGIRFAIVNAIVLSIILVTHNSFAPLPLLVGAMLALYPGARTSRKVRWTVATLTGVIPIAVWGIVRWRLDQLLSHTMDSRPKYTWGPYAHQALAGIARLLGFFGPIRFPIGTALLAITCVILLLSIAHLRKTNHPAAHAMFCYVLLALGFLATEYVEFNKTFVEDDLILPRFLLFVPLTLLPAMAMLRWHIRHGDNGDAAAHSSDRLQRSAPACGMVVYAMAFTTACAICGGSVAATIGFIHQSAANAGPVDAARAVADTGFAYNRMTVQYDYPKGPAKEVGNMLLVSPEDREFSMAIVKRRDRDSNPR